MSAGAAVGRRRAGVGETARHNRLTGSGVAEDDQPPGFDQLGSTRDLVGVPGT